MGSGAVVVGPSRNVDATELGRVGASVRDKRAEVRKAHRKQYLAILLVLALVMPVIVISIDWMWSQVPEFEPRRAEMGNLFAGAENVTTNNLDDLDLGIWRIEKASRQNAIDAIEKAAELDLLSGKRLLQQRFEARLKQLQRTPNPTHRNYTKQMRAERDRITALLESKVAERKSEYLRRAHKRPEN